MRPLQPLELLILLQYQCSWGSGIWGGGRALERIHRSKNSAKENSVAASAKVSSLGLTLSLGHCASLWSSCN